MSRALPRSSSGLAQIEQQSQELALQEQQLQASQTAAGGRPAGSTATAWPKYEQGMQELSQSTSDAQDELDDAQDEIDDLEEPDVYVLTRDENIGYASFDNDSSIVDAIANVFPIFFFLLAALGLHHHHEPHGRGAAHPARRAHGAGLRRRAPSWASTLFYSGQRRRASAASIGFCRRVAACSRLILWTHVRHHVRHPGGGHCTSCLTTAWGRSRWRAIDALRAGLRRTLACRVRAGVSVPAELMRPKAPKSRQAHPAGDASRFLWERLGFLVEGLDAQRARGISSGSS